MDPNNVVRTPNTQTQSVAPAEPEVNPTTMGPKKSGKGGIIAVILFALLAAGGIGFGVYTMLNSKTQEDALNEQITTLKKQNSELMEQIGEAGGSTVDTEDYIYFGDWNIKLKIGSGLELFNLTHYIGDNGDTYAMIAVYPDQISAISGKYGAAIDSGDSFPVNFITKSKDATYNPFGASDPENALEPIYNDGEYNYFVYRSSGAVLVNMENEANGIMEAAGDMAEILNSAANYSEI